MLTTGGDEGELLESWPAEDAHSGDGRRPVLTVVAVLQCVSGVGEQLRRHGSARRRFRRRHFLRRTETAVNPRGPPAGARRAAGGSLELRRCRGSTKQTRRGARHARGSIPPLYRGGGGRA
jgi:hypothetical protein